MYRRKLGGCYPRQRRDKSEATLGAGQTRSDLYACVLCCRLMLCSSIYLTINMAVISCAVCCCFGLDRGGRTFRTRLLLPGSIPPPVVSVSVFSWMEQLQCVNKQNSFIYLNLSPSNWKLWLCSCKYCAIHYYHDFSIFSFFLHEIKCFEN